MAVEQIPTLTGKAGKLNIQIEQGTYWNPIFNYTDSAGAPIDLTGYSAKMQIRKAKPTDPVLHELSTAAGTIVVGNGFFQLIIDEATSSAFTWTKGVYHLEIVDPAGRTQRLLEGSVELLKEITI